MSSDHLTERNNEIIRLYVEEGLPSRQVGARFGLSSAMVLQILAKAGVSPRAPGRPAGRRPTDLTQRNQEIARLYVEERLSLTEIGQRFGLSPSTVSHILPKLGVSRRRPGRRSPQHLSKRKDQIIRLYAEDRLPLVEVAERFGLSSERVRHILTKAGLDRRRRGRPANLPPRDMWERTLQIVHLYVEEGLSLRQVGARVGLTHGSVRDVLDRAGVTRRRPGRAWPDLTRRNEEMIRAYAQEGLSLSQVGERFGLGYKQVGRVLEKAGLRRRRLR